MSPPATNTAPQERLPQSLRIKTCRLPISFGDHDWARDLAGIGEDEWVTHFNTGYHDGGWSGLALRSSRGEQSQLEPDHNPDPVYRDTELLARCPVARALLGHFKCKLQTVRFLRLRPGGVIREHHDPGLSFENGVARLHVPLTTSAGAEFYLDGARVVTAVGECHYLDFNLPHRVQNLGETDRIHLVIDAEVNDWLEGLIRQAADKSAQIIHAHPASSMDAFIAFAAQVVDDPALIARLQAIEHPDDFAAAIVTCGQEHGFAFTQSDVDSAMRAGRRALMQHRVVHEQC